MFRSILLHVLLVYVIHVHVSNVKMFLAPRNKPHFHQGALFLAIFEADLIQLQLVLEKSLPHKKRSKNEFCDRLKKGDVHQELFLLGFELGKVCELLRQKSNMSLSIYTFL